MPDYTDAKGIKWPIGDYPGNSYRAIVVNRSLRLGQFIWVTVDERTFPMFTCDQCTNLVTFAGVQGDHIVAQAHGGDDELMNLQLLCSICNAADMHHRGATVANRTRLSFQQRGMKFWVDKG